MATNSVLRVRKRLTNSQHMYISEERNRLEDRHLLVNCSPFHRGCLFFFFFFFFLGWSLQATLMKKVDEKNCHPTRVLSRIYSLGEKSQVAEGHKRPRGVGGHAPPEIFLNEYALRCKLVHFETQFEKCYSGILFYFLFVITF